MVKIAISVAMLVVFVGFVYMLLTNQINTDELWQKAVNYTSEAYQELDNKDENTLAEPKKETSLIDQSVEPVIPFVAPLGPIVSEDTSAQDKPLPKLIDSDKTLQNELNAIAEQKQLWKNLRLDAIIQRFVITIDNLTKDKIPSKYLLGKPPSGKFTTRKDKSLVESISTKNYQRYVDFIQLVESVETIKILALYQKYYPLFQEAYEDIGYKNLQFNERLLEVIDHLLQTPEIKGPIKLTHPSVFYQFADPELEALSAGQKLLLRIGNKNAARLKAKLRELEFELSTMLL